MRRQRPGKVARALVRGQADTGSSATPPHESWVTLLLPFNFPSLFARRKWGKALERSERCLHTVGASGMSATP